MASGSKSSRSDWMTVLRLLEFVNLPFREAMEKNTLHLLCQCISTNWSHLVPDIGFGSVNWSQEEHPGTLSPFGRWPTYSIKALLGPRSPPSVLQILLLHFLAHFVTVGSSFFVFYVLLCHGEII